ncbi:MAG: flagellar hook assembly protein FlgD [Dechloromonas sp.]|jgi:flagellar basal-body rod modification protein FlgD|uniref:Basal-body rod modification protein FlgD n=1 Tax=Candidatus Dechloromonas phosphorivorans TaxID=2899244 RepID=A0A935MRZ6_9RHOO|nr:flagellar hook assembly protein FlgD [Candidatus Dechloromonas phosphorivorans]
MAIVGDTTSTTAAATFSAINGNSGSKTKTTSSVEDQQNKFLTLLMTQIKNQDPLNPMDNAAVTTQLAQLNTVSGIEKLNATMTQLLDGYNETQAIQSTGMIGKNVMVAGNNLPLNKSEAVGGVLLEAAADKVTLNIKDSTGKIVQTEEMGARAAGNFYFGWDGKDASGATLADGKYTFTVDASMGGKKITASALQVGTVSAVVRTKTGFVLDLGALGDVAFKDVQQIL